MNTQLRSNHCNDNTQSIHTNQKDTAEHAKVIAVDFTSGRVINSETEHQESQTTQTTQTKREYYTSTTGKMKSQPLMSIEQIAQAKQYFLNKQERFKGQNIRDYTMFICSLNLARRGGDIIHLKWKDVIDEDYNVLKHLCINEQKTKKPTMVAISNNVKHAIEMYMALFDKDEIRLDNPLFPSRNKDKNGNPKPMDLSTYWRKYQGMKEELKLAFPVGTHTPRRTYGYMAYKRDSSDANLSYLCRFYGHSSTTTTKIYTCIQQEEDDARTIQNEL